mmetsp:Transcript_37378/g.88843  ORF Transcript_37378/g.88843 Transcript_37378/m.88843 type:complete len:225 (-) Transcript_37378:55-729(-)
MPRVRGVLPRHGGRGGPRAAPGGEDAQEPHPGDVGGPRAREDRPPELHDPGRPHRQQMGGAAGEGRGRLLPLPLADGERSGDADDAGGDAEDRRWIQQVRQLRVQVADPRVAVPRRVCHAQVLGPRKRHGARVRCEQIERARPPRSGRGADGQRANGCRAARRKVPCGDPGGLSGQAGLRALALDRKAAPAAQVKPLGACLREEKMGSAKLWPRDPPNPERIST